MSDYLPTQHHEILVTRDIINSVQLEYCSLLPLPEIGSRSSELLFEILDFFESMNLYREIEDGLMKKFVMYSLSSSDVRVGILRSFYQNLDLPDNDAGIISDLLEVDDEWFVYKYYMSEISEEGRLRWIFQPEINNDKDISLWLRFQDLRDRFITEYLSEINFYTTFYMARKLEIGGNILPINHDVLMVAGFNSWWIGKARDEASQSGFSEIMFIPKNPTVDTLANFIEQDGMALWKILDETFAKETEGLWSFLFPKEKVFNAHLTGFYADSQRLRLPDTDRHYLTDITLVSKLTAHMATLWDLARIIRYYKKKKIHQLERAFRNLYQSRIQKLMKTISGEDFLSLLAVAPQLGGDKISPFGEIPGYEHDNDGVETKTDPRDVRLTKNPTVVDLRAVFTNPGNVRSLLDLNGTDVLSYLSQFGRRTYFIEEQLEKDVLDLAHFPLNQVELEFGDQ